MHSTLHELWPPHRRSGQRSVRINNETKQMNAAAIGRHRWNNIVSAHVLRSRHDCVHCGLPVQHWTSCVRSYMPHGSFRSKRKYAINILLINIYFLRAKLYQLRLCSCSDRGHSRPRHMWPKCDRARTHNYVCWILMLWIRINSLRAQCTST